jgi:hypothetical protein
VSLPAADDLFRRTSPETAEDGPPGDAQPEVAGRAPSGRVRHDEKVTVYLTEDELLDIEHARLVLRRNHGLAVDRGRLMRAAIAIALADLDEQGDDSRLVRRLTQA